MSNELATVKSDVPATVNEANPIGAMINTIISKATTADEMLAATAMVKELIGSYNDQEDRQANRDFAAAMCEVQAEIPTLIAQKKVTNKDGSLRYKCKPLPETLKEIKPYLHKHGFSIDTSTRWDENRGVAIVEISHSSGHSRRSEYSVVRSEARGGSTPTEAEEGTLTRAQRRCICNMLNLAVAQEDENNARDEGDYISQDQATAFRDRVSATKSDEKSFLAFAGAKKFEEIRESKWASLDAALSQKESEKGM